MDYFDFVYSIYGIGWTTDLQGTFNNIATYLKPGGVLICSWHHTLNYCVARAADMSCNEWDGKQLVFNRSYFDESYFTMPVDGSEVVLCNRKISTYINALAKAGFCLEQMIEQNDEKSLSAPDDGNVGTAKAKMLPISVCFKARKL